MIKAMIITPENAEYAALKLGVTKISDRHMTNNKTWLVVDEEAFDKMHALMLPHVVFQKNYSIVNTQEDHYEVERND